MTQARVARLTETDWRAFAGVRLRALTDSLGEQNPHYRQESTFTAAQWRRRLRAHAQFALVMDNRPVGLIAAQRQGQEAVYLYSLWLDPVARGHGLGRTLVAEAVDWARGQRVQRVTLRVNRDNARALAVYGSLGFVVAGDDAAAPEVTMTLTVN
ncbi:GNAT family N-acetyltransferase [Mycolicibacterium bacteremicum]|uniref:GNAT family N-acetyltransferase n=2 Tax=Mycolicibacterium bacteremicum TaxID=564198 RepID=A0A1W9YQ02_MYCBA|nr:GNAT family N-acetyltransferase [Mycolicibacterium bacteremicum]MCV7434041.1 GNAT family N-acetyltransferase [Mycolicibacterium bacteremicum]ORA02113.1 GNAT family N-acetyltransferase [Mycolicibacterium bacteremicum]